MKTLNLDQPMRGRVCLVTGGSSGMGRATSTGLAALGATLLLVSRDLESGERAAEQIRCRTGNSDVHFLPCDLSLQREVQRLAREVAERYPALHVVANCAGRLSLQREYTEEGIERTLAVDYLAHYLLTRLLLDPLRAGAPSRVITVAGGAGTLRRMRLHLDLLEAGSASAGSAAPSGTVSSQEPADGRGGPLDGLVLTGQAAVARVLFTFELARRLRGSGVTANAFYPGLVRTRLDRNLPWPLRLPVRLAWPLLQADCPTSVYLASSPSVAGISGQFFARSHPVDLLPHAVDLETSRGLWEASERLTGERLAAGAQP